MRYILIFCVLGFYSSLLNAQTTNVRITLYDEMRFNNGLSPADGLVMSFSSGQNNDVDGSDAPKFFNIDETFARQNGSVFLSIERRDIPLDNERLLFYNITYRSQDYIYLIQAFQFDDLFVYLKDTYTGRLFEVGTGVDVTIPFSVDSNTPSSLEPNRFEISFIKKSDYIYDNAWTNLNPCTTAITDGDNLNILSGNTIIDCDMNLKNITVAEGATLEIATGRTVTINGDVINLGTIITTDATLVINNDSNFYAHNAQLGSLIVNDSNNLELAGSIDVYGAISHSGTGTAIIDNKNAVTTLKSTATRNAYYLPTNLPLTAPVVSETYMSPKRAFRLISSPVTTIASIFENWQENGDESITGLGTDITGTAGAAAGFDTTATNNPSMYSWDNISQSWNAQTSTNSTVDVIEKGVPYRLFIRGDRQVDLTSNANAQRETVLRTIGMLHNGDYSPTVLSNVDGAFNMIGNPYAAPFHLDGLLTTLNATGAPADAPGTRPAFFYVWDPTLQSRGAYVTYDTEFDFTSNSLSEVNGFLQPYQVAFVITNGNAGNFTFKESYLDIDQAHIQVTTISQLMRIQLVKNQSVKDGVVVKFNASYSNLLDENDAPKISNLEENLSIIESQNHLSIAARNTPMHGEVIPLHLSQLATETYNLEISPVTFDNLDAFIVDQFTGQSALLDRMNTTSYPFSYDNNNPQSSDPSRFQIEFMNSTLSVDDSAFAKVISIYPNPSQNGLITINNPTHLTLKNVSVYNTLGQKLREMSALESSGTIDLSSFAKGTYLLRLNLGEKVVTKKVILE